MPLPSRAKRGMLIVPEATKRRAISLVLGCLDECPSLTSASACEAVSVRLGSEADGY